jgi:chromosome segregation ATPase
MRRAGKFAQVTARELAELMTLLASLNLEIATLNEEYAKASAELNELQLQASLMEKRLTAASKVCAASLNRQSGYFRVGDLRTTTGKV